MPVQESSGGLLLSGAYSYCKASAAIAREIACESAGIYSRPTATVDDPCCLAGRSVNAILTA